MRQNRERSLLKTILVLSLCCLLRVPGWTQESSPDDQPSQSGTLFPHSQTARWWVSGQVNIVFQGHPGFHALYSGPNSLRADGEHATSRLLTLYTGFAITKDTEILFDVESAGGEGISNAL